MSPTQAQYTPSSTHPAIRFVHDFQRGCDQLARGFQRARQALIDEATARILDAKNREIEVLRQELALFTEPPDRHSIRRR